jgi:hypothetical protein
VERRSSREAGLIRGGIAEVCAVPDKMVDGWERFHRSCDFDRLLLALHTVPI